MGAESTGNEPKLALMCLYPDWGHVKPLLNIAFVAAESGFDVRFFIPNAASRLIEDHGFPVTRINIDSGEDMARLFRTLSRKNAFSLNFSGYSHTNLLIYPNILQQALENMDYLKGEFRDFSPDLMICDSHLFGSIYENLSESTDTPMLINDPSGTLAANYRLFDRYFGLKRNVPAFAKTAVESAGLLHEFLYRRAFYLFHWRKYLDARDIKAKIRKTLAEDMKHPPIRPAVRNELTLGLGWIELEILRERGTGGDDRKRYFPPAIASREKISKELLDWMIEKDGIIYVSLGSIISLTLQDIEGLVSSFKELGRPVIWSTPKYDFSIVKSVIGDDPRFFVTTYVAQATLLRDPRVALFVTHGGANSVQEALLAGTPMLCVPFYADALYIASLVERLGTGTIVPKRQLRAGNSLANAIRQIAQDSSYAKRAKKVSVHIQAGSAASNLGQFLRDSSRPRAPSQPEMAAI